MSDVKWIKIVTDIFDDEKILIIESMPDSYAIIVVWFKLLCLAGKQNNGGVFTINDRIAYTDEMFSAVFRMPISTVRLALNTFENLGMIEIINGTITIPNWEKHQNVDRLSELKEYNRLAQQKSREKRKLLASVNDMSMTCQSSQGTDIDIDKDIDREEDKNKVTGRKRPQRTTFTPPTVEEVRAYCSANGYEIDAQHFVDYYESNGWRVGKNPMKNWQAAVRTWVRNNFRNGGTSGAINQQPASEDDIFAGFTAEQIAEVERLANDGRHWG